MCSMAAGEGRTEALAKRLCEEVRELSLGSRGEIERIEGAPSSLRFLRDFVLPNKPCIISNAIAHWPALTAWTNAYLRAALHRLCVSVHSTPHGFADALVDLDAMDYCPSYISMASQAELCHNISSEVVQENWPDDANSACNAESQEEVVRSEGVQEIWPDDANSACNVESREEIVGPDARDDAEGAFATCLTAKDPVSAPSVRRRSDLFCSPLLGSRAAVCPEQLAPKQGENGDVGMGLISMSRREISLNGCSGSASSESDRRKKCGSLGAHGIRRDPERQGHVWFVTAHVDRVPFPMALDMILHSEIGIGVAYAQEQNGCFLSEYSALASDAEEHLPWATEAFGSLPEAVNLWIGNEKAVTSFHKDHYENLYAVIAGEKHFTLLPPTDVHRLYVRQYPSAHYVKHNDKFTIEQDKPVKFVPWSRVNPYPPAELAAEVKSQFPEYFNGPKPFTCTLRKGEILYLPSLWFHHVRQSSDMEGRAIALNFWYDMQFDIKYAYYNFLESLMSEAN